MTEFQKKQDISGKDYDLFTKAETEDGVDELVSDFTIGSLMQPELREFVAKLDKYFELMFEGDKQELKEHQISAYTGAVLMWHLMK